jgi:hypothetical protein
MEATSLERRRRASINICVLVEDVDGINLRLPLLVHSSLQVGISFE